MKIIHRTCIEKNFDRFDNANNVVLINKTNPAFRYKNEIVYIAQDDWYDAKEECFSKRRQKREINVKTFGVNTLLQIRSMGYRVIAYQICSDKIRREHMLNKCVLFKQSHEPEQ